MHLRHLIVLIIDARNAGSRSCNRGLGLGLERNLSMPHGMVFDRSDQINQNSRGLAVSRRGAPQTSSEPSLNDVERSGRVHPKRMAAAKLALCSDVLGQNWWSRSESNRRPIACKATALPTELRPHSIGRWWARVDSNYRPHAYQACALTT